MRDRKTLDSARELLVKAYAEAAAHGLDSPRTTKPLQRAVDTLSADDPTLSQEDVAVLLGIDDTTVSKYRTRSRPGGEYAEHPFPSPDNTSRYPIWMVTNLPKIFAWQVSRPGRSGATGRVWHQGEAPKPELLEQLPEDWWTVDDVLTYLEAIGQKIARKTLLRKIGDEDMPQPERTFGSERAWVPATIKAWRSAEVAAAR